MSLYSRYDTGTFKKIRNTDTGEMYVMAIPKVIHYCWFGGKPLPRKVVKCIASWKRYCPDYEIIRWDETNFDVQENLYIKEAYENERWAFVSDYARLKIIYENGGIYLDTDVKLIKPLDDLLEYEGFMGFQNREIINQTVYETVATGLGFGAVARHPVIKMLLEDYLEIPFLKSDGSMDLTPCPERSTKTLMKMGLKDDGKRQEICGIQIFPAEYFCPLDRSIARMRITENTYSIHLFSASWYDEEERKWLIPQRLIGSSKSHTLRYKTLPAIKKPIKRLLEVFCIPSIKRKFLKK